MRRLPDFVLVACVLASPSAACNAVEGDEITGKDLAAASPLFAALDPNLPVSVTPSPGARQILRAEQLARLAQRNDILSPAPLVEVCFERATEPLTVDRLIPVLRAALALDTATIEILDFSQSGVPRGDLEFKRAGLTPSGLWRGRLVYSAGRSVPVWVRTRVTIEQSWIESPEMLPAGKPIEAGQLVVQTGPRFPFGPQPLDSVSLAQGRAAIRNIRPSTPIYASMLQPPRDVERGDKVIVEVSCGAALLVFEALAESPGRIGEHIVVRNPENGRVLRVRVEARGKVSIKA